MGIQEIWQIIMENPAKFFDKFGIGVFTFFLVDAIVRLAKARKKKKVNWWARIELTFAILGLIVDGGLVLFG